MDFDEVRDTATGLEDDDNFFELVRSRAALSDIEAAVRLSQQVLLYVARGYAHEQAREFVRRLPSAVERYVYPKLDFERDEGLDLAELERELCVEWGVDLDIAARFVAAVGLTVCERIDPLSMQVFRQMMPPAIRRAFPDRDARVAA